MRERRYGIRSVYFRTGVKDVLTLLVVTFHIERRGFRHIEWRDIVAPLSFTPYRVQSFQKFSNR